MAERIEINSPLEPAVHLAISAIVQAEATREVNKVKQDREAAGAPRGFLEVELRVNGVEVPFAATVRDIFLRFEDDVQRRAAEIAYDQAKLKGLEKLRETISRADWEIRQKIEEVFGVTLPED